MQNSFLITLLKRLYLFIIGNTKKFKRLGNEKNFISDVFAKNFYEAQEKFYKNPQLMIDFLKNHSIYDLWCFYTLSENGPHYRMPWGNNFMTKLPMDVWIYKTLINKCRPNMIIEIGTQRGHSAKLLKELSQEFNTKIVTFDILKPSSDTLSKFQDLDIAFFNTDASSSIALENVLSLKEKKNEIRALVIDDGSHLEKDIISSFNLFKDLVPNGGFYIIEDAFTNQILENKKFLSMNAITQILNSNKNFSNYAEYDDFLFSSSYMGVLQKN